MDLKPIIVVKVKELSKEAPSEFTFGDILYSFLRHIKPEGVSLNFVRELSNRDIYTALEKEIEFQIEDNGE